MENALSKESHTFHSHSSHSNVSAWPAFLEPYIKQVESYWFTIRKTTLTYWYTVEQVAKALWQ